LILALARQIPEAADAVRQGKWPRYSGISIEGKTVGILGLGAIGKQLARRLSGFDCRVMAYDPFADPVSPGTTRSSLPPWRQSPGRRIFSACTCLCCLKPGDW
jgi:phosphoglycerate dehydrogenase-like enzyme